MRKPICFAFLLWLLMADLATAGDYKLVLGKGIEVCEAFLKNLNSFPNDPPMVCERKINPKFPEFSTPTWQPLDAQEHLALIEEIERWKPYETGFDDPIQREKMLAQITERIKNGVIRLTVTDLDIDEDGVAETVLKYEYADCDPANESQFAGMSGRSFYVLAAEKMTLDKGKSGNFSMRIRGDIFLFKKHTYITVWSGNLGFKDGLLSVYRPFSLIGHEPGRCDYRHKASKTRRQP